METSLTADTATVEGVRFHYLVGGPEKGRPLVFLHGIGGGVEDWSENVGHFLEQGYRVYVVSLPGHGDSGPLPRDWDRREDGRKILGFMDALNINRATLIGHSAGGLLALQVALEDRKRVEALVLVAPGGLGRHIGWKLRLLTLPLVGRFMLQPSRRQARAVMQVMFADPSRVRKEMIETWLERRRDPGQRTAFLQLLRRGIGLRGLHRDLVLTSRLGEVGCPVLMAWGREDRITPYTQGQDAVAHFPQGRLLTLSPCGHWPHVEQVEAFNQAVLEFLEGLV